MLARAFCDDPLMEYVIPDRSRRLSISSWLYSTSVRYGLLFGQVCATPNLEGVAVWLGPGRTTMTFCRIASAGMLGTPFKLGLQAFMRLTNFNSCKDRLHKQSAPPEHWYLLLLAVDPSCQGKGVGATLLQSGLAWADRDGVPCYLETTNEHVLPFYGKFGFKTVAQGNVLNGGPAIWAMVRAPTAVHY